MKIIGVPFLTLAMSLGLSGQAVNPDAALVKAFEDKVGDYIKIRKAVESKLPALKQSQTQAAIKARQRDLARALREARQSPRQGDFFRAEIAAEFKRLIGLAMKGQDAARVHRSLKSAEPVKLRLQVGGAYPEGIPLQSTPPTLLLNLPTLPPELEYRVVDHALVLRDSKANLILDFIPDAIP